MSKALANKLMSAESPEAFLRDRRTRSGWEMFAALKMQVDNLVHIDLNAARSLVERIEQVAALTGDPASTSFARAGRARLLHVLGNHSEANDFYNSAAIEMRAAKLRTHAAILQKQQVDTLTHMGRYDEALRVARAARRVLASFDRVQLAQLETHVGNVYYLLDRYPRALNHYDRARSILSGSGDRATLAVIDFSRSNIFTETDRPDEALALLESAADALDRAGRKMRAAQARFHIAYLHFLRGNYNTALTGYYQARDRLTELGNPELVAWCNLEIAEILLSLNSFDEAAETAESARSRFNELGMSYEAARSAVVHALAGMGMGELDEAQSALASARDVFAGDRNATFTAYVDSYLAELALRRGDHAEAALRAKLSLRVFSRQKLATRAGYSRLLAARAAYQSGDRTRAMRMAKSALASAEGRSTPAVVYQCDHLIGRINRDRRLMGSALASFRRAVDTVEHMRGGIAADEFKATFLRDKIEVYEDAIAACLDEGGVARLEEAFRLVESSKSRSLADLLARYLRNNPAAKPGTARGREGETRARLLKLIEDLNWYSSQAGLEEDKGGQRKAGVAERYRGKVRQCERQIGQLFRRLEAQGSAFAEIQRMQAATSQDLCAVLEHGETAIEYFTTGDDVSALIASRDNIRVERGIASKRDVERLLAGLRFQLEKFNYGSGFANEHFEQLNHATNQHLIQLYELIFARLEPFIDSDRLIVMPHGALHYVPFHALLDRRGYLIDRFEVSYAPSTAVLKLCRQRGARMRSGHPGNGKAGQSKGSASQPRLNVGNHGKMVALGVSDGDTPSIDVEVNALRGIFSDAVTLTGREATRANLMKFAPAARFVHLASHGYFRRDNPMFSFLKLADSSLNFYNLLDLKLNAEMVTLSACHTGVNMVFPGDELHGLMRGFLYAGAPSVVASLWAANDTSTAQFMSTMYSHIQAGDTKRAALRAAQLAVKDAFGHPYYWAPFILMGNPD